MTFDEFKNKVDESWASGVREGEQFKDPFIALDRLRTLFDRLDRHERQHGEHVMAIWLEGSDRNKRFAAMHMIRQLRMASCIASLEGLRERLSSDQEPGANGEREMVDTLLERLRRT